MDEKNLVVKKVSVLGIICNLFLLIIKIISGLVFKSQAMLADGVSSAGDIFASLMSFIGNRISSKPSDNDHPYGHGKAEYIFSQIIGLSMIVVAFIMIKNSIESIIYRERLEFSILLLVVAIITIILKTVLYLYTKKMYIKNKSILIKSSMEDHRNDIFVTSGTLIGILFSLFGIYFIDGIVGCLISLWILSVGFNIFKTSYRVLMDTSLDDDILKEISDMVLAYEEVKHLDVINTKPIGDKYILILKIAMKGDYTIIESHDIGKKIKNNIKDKYEFVNDVIIHINPYNKI